MSDVPVNSPAPEDTDQSPQAQPLDDVLDAMIGKAAEPDAQPTEGDESVPPTTELAQADDRLLRTQAELENYRKRSRRELVEQRRYANMTLIRELLGVVDNIDRAIAAAEAANEAESLLLGFKLVGQQLHTILDQHDCKKIEADGAVFDPHLHEAVSQQPSDEYPQGNIMYVTVVGYTLHDRVVRPSQVVVSAGPET